MQFAKDFCFDYLELAVAQLAGAVEYTDCTSAEGYPQRVSW